jgi:hypothetical protein
MSFPLLAEEAAVSAAAQVCSGRYASSVEILNAMKYGTLYSGGVHWLRLDDVGQSVDMYRLWRGLPDWRLRDAGETASDVDRDAAAAHVASDTPGNFDWLTDRSPENGKSMEETFTALHALDIHGVATYPADAWLDDASERSLLELWLQFILTASDAQWANIPMLIQGDAREESFVRLRDEALRRYRAKDGMEWAVAAQLLDPPRFSSPNARKTGREVNELDALFRQWQDKVFACKASTREYAAWAVVAPYQEAAEERFLKQQEFFPEGIARQLVEYRSRWDIGQYLLNPDYYSDYNRYGYRSDNYRGRSGFVAKAAQKIKNPEDRAWLNAGLAFGDITDSRKLSAKEMATLLNRHKGQLIHHITATRFNLLLPEDMLQLAREGDLSRDMGCSLISTAFARYVTQEENAKALPLASEILPCFPEATRERLDEILRRNVPDDVKNALFALHAPLISSWVFYDDITAGQNNLPKYPYYYHYADQSKPSEQIVNRACSAMTATELVADYAAKRDIPWRIVLGDRSIRDRGEWLLHPRFWHVFWTDRYAYTIDFITRTHHNRSWEVSENVRRGRNTPVLPSVDPERLRFPNNLARYAGGNGFSHVISVNIIRWAEMAAGKGIENLDERSQVAEALRRVVRMNRYNDGGMLDGRPAGQRAYAILHRDYSDSEAAKTTCCWYKPSPALDW